MTAQYNFLESFSPFLSLQIGLERTFLKIMVPLSFSKYFSCPTRYTSTLTPPSCWKHSWTLLSSLHFCDGFATLTLESPFPTPSLGASLSISFTSWGVRGISRGLGGPIVGVGRKWGHRVWVTYRCLRCSWNSPHSIWTKERNPQQRSTLGPLKDNSGRQVAGSLKMWNHMPDPWIN